MYSTSRCTGGRHLKLLLHQTTLSSVLHLKGLFVCLFDIFCSRFKYHFDLTFSGHSEFLLCLNKLALRTEGVGWVVERAEHCLLALKSAHSATFVAPSLVSAVAGSETQFRNTTLVYHLPFLTDHLKKYRNWRPITGKVWSCG